MRWDRDYKNPEVINDPVIIPAYGVTDEERAYWNNKQNPLEYDAEPTPYSDKHLISGAVYNALEQYKLSTVQICQAYYNNQAQGLTEAITRCEQASINAGASANAAAASETAAASAATAAALSESNSAVSETHAGISESNAESFAMDAAASVYDSEAWAVGTRNGVPVDPADPAYHNNSEYYASLGQHVINDELVTAYTTYSSEKTEMLLAFKADLVNGKVPASQLPSYVDDILEYPDVSDFPAEGESSKIYIATSTDKLYRWTGSAYVEIPDSIALGETSSTAYAGDKGKANADTITAITALIPNTASASNMLATANDVPTQISQLNDDASHRTVSDTEKTAWNNKAAGEHNHDTRYYTKTEVNTMFAGVTFTIDSDDDICINW